MLHQLYVALNVKVTVLDTTEQYGDGYEMCQEHTL